MHRIFCDYSLNHLHIYLDDKPAPLTERLHCFPQVFEDLYTYMRSLQRLLDERSTVIYPAHGPVVSDPATYVGGYIQHRNARERQIMDCLREHSPKALTAMGIVKQVYSVSTLPRVVS